MKKTFTNKETSKKMAAYSAMAGAFVLASAGAQAQISYTDVDPDETYDSDGDLYELDLNNDGDVDFAITVVDLTYPGLFSTTGTAGYTFAGLMQDVFAMPYNGAIAGYTNGGSYVYPYALNNGDEISDALSFHTASVQSMVYYLAVLDFPSSGSIYPFLSSGDWIGAEDKYLGLRLDVGGDSFYGWARLDCSDNHHEFTIKDYAVQGTADAAIDAGQSVNVFTVIQNSQLTAYSYGNTINVVVKDLKTTGATVKVFNAAGQVVFNDGLDMAGMNITLNDAATGNYVLQVVTEENAVYTKSLHIQN